MTKYQRCLRRRLIVWLTQLARHKSQKNQETQDHICRHKERKKRNHMALRDACMLIMLRLRHVHPLLLARMV